MIGWRIKSSYTVRQRQRFDIDHLKHLIMLWLLKWQHITTKRLNPTLSFKEVNIMAQSMTIPEIRHLVKRTLLRATGLQISIKDIDIRKVLTRDNDSIAASWFNSNSMYAGAMCYLIDWDNNMIYITNDRNRILHGEIKFDGRY